MKFRNILSGFSVMLFLVILAACSPSTVTSTAAPVSATFAISPVEATAITTSTLNQPTPAVTTAGPSTPMAGATLLQTGCTGCHGLGMVTRDRFNAAGWKLVVDDMIGRGANLSPSEETILIDYLTKTYGK